MVNYNNGKIYKIIAIDAVAGDGEVYIGSISISAHGLPQVILCAMEKGRDRKKY